MRTRTLVLLLGAAMLVGLAFPLVHGADECPNCKLLKEKQLKETATLQQQIKNLETQKAELEKECKKTVMAWWSLSMAVGFLPDAPRAEYSDEAAIRKFVRGELEALTRRDSVVVPAKGYVEVQNGGFAREREDGRVKVTYWNAPALPASTTLEILFKIRSAGVTRMREDIRRLAERVEELSR